MSEETRLSRRRLADALLLRSPGRKWVTSLVCVLVGLMVAVSALNAKGFDLRPGRNTELVGLISDQSRRNEELTRTAAGLQREVDELSQQAGAPVDTTERLAVAASQAGFEPVRGPGFTVTLTDAPASVQIPGVDDDLLIVHQQDIQAVVNAFWAAGAEAMTIQGQRVISTTGVKCVGNSVVLHGRPYAPPYVISAIGDPDRLAAALASSPYLKAYREHSEAYSLGYQQKREQSLRFPAYEGSLDLQYASVAGS